MLYELTFTHPETGANTIMFPDADTLFSEFARTVKAQLKTDVLRAIVPTISGMCAEFYSNCTITMAVVKAEC